MDRTILADLWIHPIGIEGYLGIFATMMVIALLTTITARLTVIRTIDDIDRVRSDPSKSEGV